MMYHRLFSTHPQDFSTLVSEQLKARFVIQADLDHGCALTHAHDDRMTFGHVVPRGRRLVIRNAADEGHGPLERCELAILCLSGDGWYDVGAGAEPLARRDLVYVGSDQADVTVGGSSAHFYLVAAPAHQALPTRVVRSADINAVELGRPSHSKKRTTSTYLDPTVFPTCQLLLGVTDLHESNVWHTIPPHTHENRTELYMYFNLAQDERIFHLMGTPPQVRTLVLRDLDTVVCPPWSLHSAAGTTNYSFVWAMAGVNLDFNDIARVGLDELS